MITKNRIIILQIKCEETIISVVKITVNLNLLSGEKMKIIRLVLLLAISVSMYAQLTQFNEGFEVFPPAGWQLIDHDGDGKKWEKFDLPIYVHSGLQCAASFSSDYENSQAPLQPDNYLITPQVQILNNSVLEFYAGTQSNTYYAEPLEVRLSTTGSNYEDFTTVLFNMVFNSVPNNNTRWEHVTLNLAPYAGNNGYIAFVHRSQEHNFAVKVDDVALKTETSIENSPVLNNGIISSSYPNPFNPSTSILFELKTGANVQITLFNGKGELVRTLLNENRSAGSHSLVLDGSALNSGVYFYKITSGSQSSVNKIVLSK